LHELIKGPLQWIFDEAFNFELPVCEIDVGRSVCIEHGPLLRARLSRRNAFLAPRVGTDDDLGIFDLFRLTRIGCLIFWVL
jgi:hypothetical protein